MPVMTPPEATSSSYMPQAASGESSRKGVPGIEQRVDAVARQQLAAGDVLLAVLPPCRRD